ncbi:MAG: glycoside hydrolase family 88 protein [Terriglobales bacterium]
MPTRSISIVVGLLIVCLNAAFAQSLATVTSPVPNSALTGASATFQWTASDVATAYWIDVGSVAGGNQYYQSGSLSMSTLSATVNDLPTNGSTIYVTMYSLIIGSWVNNAYTYTAFNSALGKGVITTPASGSTLSGSSVPFQWSAGTGATAYWLDVGNAAGGNQYEQSGNLGNVLSTTVNGLPTNGSTVYVTLYSLVSGQWLSSAYTYAAFNATGALAVMQTPVPGSTLTGNTAIFTWSSDPSATAYWLDIGNVAGGNQYYQSGNLGNVLTTTVYSLPANGTTVYVTLYSLVAGQWLNNAYAYVSDPLQLPSQAQVLGAIENVNNFWIPNNNSIVFPGETPGNSDWDQATYFAGDLAAYDATGQANYLSFAQSWASQNNYSLLGGNTTTWPDYQAAGQVYIRLYQLSNTSSDLSGITESINGMVNSTVDNEWTWVDAINMSMPNFAELGSIYNNTNYFTKMYTLYSYAKYSLGLYDSTTGLWWRDSTYVNTSTFWSRGDGWVFAAHAKVLSVLPKSDPHYAEYLSTFTTMAQALAARQQPGGYWNSDLGGTDYAGPESSGTSFFLYGLAWGLNNGILDQNTYLPVVEKAWNFFANTAIQPSGLLGYVQPSPACNCPGPTSATTTYDYGVGAFLLAGRQMALLTQ